MRHARINQKRIVSVIILTIYFNNVAQFINYNGLELNEYMGGT